MARLLKKRLSSSSISSVTYDPKDGLLQVVFRRTGHVYVYFGVLRAIYRDLMDADSKGTFLNQVLKPNFEYARVEIPFA
jgi:hypothetical protein